MFKGKTFEGILQDLITIRKPTVIDLQGIDDSEEGIALRQDLRTKIADLVNAREETRERTAAAFISRIANCM